MKAWTSVTIAAMLVLVSLLPVATMAQPGDGIELLGSTFDRWYAARDLVVKGGLVYQCTGPSGLRILEVSDPAAPVEVFAYPGIKCNWIDVQGTVAVVYYSDELQVLDVSDPATIEVVGVVDDVGSTIAKYVDVQGNLAVLGGASYVGWQLFDISDPANPFRLVQHITGESAWDPTLHGNVLFTGVRHDAGGLNVFDISDPTDPQLITRLLDGALIHSIEISGDLLYAAEANILHVIDISDPSSPESVGAQSGIGWEITVAGNRLYTYDEQVLRAWSLSDPLNPVLLGSVEQYSEDSIDYYLEVYGQHVLLGDMEAGLRVFDFSVPAAAEQVARVNPIGGYASIAVRNERLLAAHGEHGLRVLSMRDPVNITEISRIPGNDGGASDICLVGHRALVQESWEVLREYDVNSFETPVPTGDTYVPYGTGGQKMVAGDDLAVILQGWDRLHVLTLHEDGPPQLVDTYLYPGMQIADLVLVNDIVYLCCESYGDGINAIDLSDPANPVEMTPLVLDTDGPLVRSGDYLFTYREYDNQLLAVDISDRANPVFASHTQLTDPLNVMVAERGYLALQTEAGIEVLDARDVQNIVSVGSYPFEPSSNVDMQLKGGRLYVRQSYGLQVFDCRDAMGLPRIDLELSMDTPAAVGRGGRMPFDLHVANTTGEAVQLDFWTEAISSNGETVLPVALRPNRLLETGWVLDTSHWTRRLPMIAPLGQSMFKMYAGSFPDGVAAVYEYPFLVDTWLDVDEPGQGGADGTALPDRFALTQPSPNPFNPATVLTLALPQPSDLEVMVFDITGRKVATLADGTYPAGRHALTVDGSRWASGVYFVRAVVPGELDVTRKLVLMK